MGPKVEAACRFVEATAKRAVIGGLDEAGELLEGTRGTTIELGAEAIDLPAKVVGCRVQTSGR